MFYIALEWTWLSGSSRGNPVHTISGRHQQPGGLSGAAIWTEPDAVWLFGGRDLTETGSSSFKTQNELWLLKNMSWTLKYPMSHDEGIAANTETKETPAPSTGAAMCGISEKHIVLFTGSVNENSCDTSTWVFHIQSNKWQHLTACQRSCIGENDNVLSSIKSVSKRWKQNSDSATNGSSTSSTKSSIILQEACLHSSPTPRQAMVWWCDEDKMLIYGGKNSSGSLMKDFWIFSLTELEWTKIGLTANTVNTQGATWWINKDEVIIYESGVPGPRGFLWKLELPSLQLNHHRQKGDQTLHVGQVIHIPQKRAFAMGWTTENGDLLLYGGVALTDQGTPLQQSSLLDDLWVFEITDLAWLKMPPLHKSTHGQKNMTSIYYFPGPRAGAATWSSDRNLMLLGGICHSTDGDDDRDIRLDDLWSLRLINPEEFFNGAAGGLMNKIRLEVPESRAYVIFFATSVAFLLISGLAVFVRRFVRCTDNYDAVLRRQAARMSYLRVVES